MARSTAQSSSAATDWSEADRVAALRAYDIVDSGPELAFDDLANLAAQACDAPFAVINFIESTRQWFKAEVGLNARETPLDLSICVHALRQDGLFIVPDTTKDARFSDNPLVTGEPHLRFYAGAVLATAEGLPLGTLCVLDHQARPEGLTAKQTDALLALARQVMVQLEHRRLLRRLSQREAELAESEQKFRAISDSIDQMIWSTTPDGLHDFYNRRWYEFTGVPEGSTDGESWNGMFHPADQERAWASWRHSLSTGESYHIEYRLRHRSGQYRWVLGRAQPERDKLGRITRWYGTCTDIHDLKVTQDALAESETRFRTLVEVSPQVVWFGDARGEITYCNAYWYDYTGLTPGDISSDGWASVIHPDHRERILGVWKHAAQNANSYELEIPFRRAADGTYRWFLARGLPIRNDQGVVERWVGIALDIHERTLAEEANARLGAIVSSSTDAIISCDPESGRIQTWNQGAEDLFGYTPAEVIGSSVSLLVPTTGLAPPENERGVFDLVKAQGSVTIESRRCHKDGTVIKVAITATRIAAPDGRLLGVAATFRDITARKQTERALAQERARLKAVFETVPVGILIADAATGQIIDGNPQVERILRHPVLPSASIESYKEWVAFHPDGRQVEGHEYPLARAIMTGESSQGEEYRYHRGDGTFAWIRVAGAPIRDSKGAISGGVIAVVDIDKEKRAEEAARQGEARLRKLIEASPIGLVIGDRAGNPTYANPTAQQLLGYSAEEFGRQQVPWAAMTPAEWGPADAAARQHLFEQGSHEPYEKEYVAKDGSRVPVLVAAALLDPASGGEEEIATYLVDLTVLRQTQVALRDREALLLNIFQSEGLYTSVVEVLEDDVRYLMANERSATFWGREASGIEGQRLSDLGLDRAEINRWVSFMRECYAKGTPSMLEFPFASGERTYHFLGTFTPLPQSVSERPTLSLVAIDITDRKRLEEQQALVTRELHHRVKNTLATVQALVSSTARYARTITEFQQSVTDRIASLAKTHTLLINDQWGGASLREILQAELSPYDDAIGHRVRLEGPELYLRYEMALAMSMAAHELTTNAAKYGAFSLPTGSVDVRWDVVPAENGEQRLSLTWVERDGPTVEAPSRTGFGSVLLQRVLGRQLGGEVEIRYETDGVCVRVTALLPKLQ